MDIRISIDDDLAAALPALEARLGRPIAEWLAEVVEGNLEAEVRAAGAIKFSVKENRTNRADWELPVEDAIEGAEFTIAISGLQNRSLFRDD